MCARKRSRPFKSDATEKFRLRGSQNPHPPSSELRTSLNQLNYRAAACADCRTSSGKRQAGALLRSAIRAVVKEKERQCRQLTSSFVRVASRSNTKRPARLCRVRRKNAVFARVFTPKHRVFAAN